MIKLLIFDLDGVLVRAKEIHYEALNRALVDVDEKYVIERDEHLSKYDGLPTRKKLARLTKEKGLPLDKHDHVWMLKQEKTIDVINDIVHRDERLCDVMRRLKKKGYIICCASNSIRETTKLMLIRSGLAEYIDFWYSNQDVIHPKPHAEMYLHCMIKAGVNPKETLIIEDSHIGRAAANNSGAYLCAVVDVEDVTYDKIINAIKHINQNRIQKPRWQGGDMNVLIPMAGAGRRFEQAGYNFPKPLVDICGKPMIQVVVENLNINARHIFIVQKSHYEQYNLKYLLNLIAPRCEIIQVDYVTEGAACTTLLAKDLINNDHPLVVANSDQYVEWDSNEFMYSMVGDDIDGGILTFTSTHVKWSYVQLDNKGFVSRVAEKQVISDMATVGIYYYRKGCEYVKYAQQMIDKNIRTNNEFYVAPVYNEFIKDGKKIKTYHIDKMMGLGDPQSLEHFIRECHDGKYVI